MSNRKRGVRLMTPETARAVDAGTYDPAAFDEKPESFLSREIEWFSPKDLIPHPDNHVFDALKTPKYWELLKNDIADAGAILEPLWIMPDNTIISGHSRRQIALELLEAGNEKFAKIPVRQILVRMDKHEQRRRVYLANLSRFQIDEDTWLHMCAEIYPEYFSDAPPMGGDTVSPSKSNKKITPTVKQIAAETGKSPRQVMRDKKTVKRAEEIAKEEGTSRTPQHVAQARKETNAKRRTATKAGDTVSRSKGNKKPTPKANDTTPSTDIGPDAVELDHGEPAGLAGGHDARRDEIRAYEDAIAVLRTAGVTGELFDKVVQLIREHFPEWEGGGNET